MDSDVPFNTVLAWSVWVLAFGLIALGYWVDCVYLAACGVAFSGVAATLQVRCFITRLVDREQRAFELGRDSVRSIR